MLSDCTGSGDAIGSCPIPSLNIGDGYCDDKALIEECNFDRNENGVSDCCGFNGLFCQYCYCLPRCDGDGKDFCPW